MKKVFQYVLAAAGIYVAVNWLADNPKSVRAARDAMNNAVSQVHRQVL